MTHFVFFNKIKHRFFLHGYHGLHGMVTLHLFFPLFSKEILFCEMTVFFNQNCNRVKGICHDCNFWYFFFFLVFKKQYCTLLMAYIRKRQSERFFFKAVWLVNVINFLLVLNKLKAIFGGDCNKIIKLNLLILLYRYQD